MTVTSTLSEVIVNRPRMPASSEPSRPAVRNTESELAELAR